MRTAMMAARRSLLVSVEAAAAPAATGLEETERAVPGEERAKGTPGRSSLRKSAADLSVRMRRMFKMRMGSGCAKKSKKPMLRNR